MLGLSIRHTEDGPNLPFDDDEALEVALEHSGRRSYRFQEIVKRIHEMRLRLAAWREYVDSAAVALALLAHDFDDEGEKVFPDTQRERERFLQKLQRQMKDGLPPAPAPISAPHLDESVQAIRRFRQAEELIKAARQVDSGDRLRYLYERLPWTEEVVAALSEEARQTLRKCLDGKPPVGKVRANERPERYPAALLAAPLLKLKPTSFLRWVVDASPVQPARIPKGGRKRRDP